MLTIAQAGRSEQLKTTLILYVVPSLALLYNALLTYPFIDALRAAKKITLHIFDPAPVDIA